MDELRRRRLRHDPRAARLRRTPRTGRSSWPSTRVKATGDRIGSLFVNPGGPGGSAVDYAKAADYIVSPSVREYFDIVGLDPRGVGLSDPVECLTDAQLDELGAADGTPDSAAEEAGDHRALRPPGRWAAPRSPIRGTRTSARSTPHATSTSHVRWSKDETLTYLGKSYGTMLGATYAELFPDRVGRMVLDGVLPASLDLVEVTKGQADAFEVAVLDFARDCLTHSDCPLSGSPEEAVGQLQEWLAGLDANPIRGSDRDLNEPLAAYAVLANLYFPGYDYPRLRSALAAAIERDDADADARASSTPASVADPTVATSTTRPRPSTRSPASTGRTTGRSTTCGPLPRSGRRRRRPSVPRWRGDCSPARTGRHRRSRSPRRSPQGSNPILVVSTRKDPATPYQWGTLLADELDNATLVTYEGVGHTAYGELGLRRRRRRPLPAQGHRAEEGPRLLVSGPRALALRSAAGAAAIAVAAGVLAGMTPAGAIDAGPLPGSVAVIGDFGAGSDGQREVADLVASARPRAVVSVGDNVYDDRGYEALVGDYYGPWVASEDLIPAVGNHDHEEGIAAFDAYFSYLDGRHVYSAGRAGMRFFVLDSTTALDSSASMKRQRDWLKRSLLASRARWKVVVLHHAAVLVQ